MAQREGVCKGCFVFLSKEATNQPNASFPVSGNVVCKEDTALRKLLDAATGGR